MEGLGKYQLDIGLVYGGVITIYCKTWHIDTKYLVFEYEYSDDGENKIPREIIRGIDFYDLGE